jgi:hypothetical protein
MSEGNGAHEPPLLAVVGRAIAHRAALDEAIQAVQAAVVHLESMLPFPGSSGAPGRVSVTPGLPG